MRTGKKIGLTLLILFLIIQFFRPARNSSATVLPADITNIAAVPADVQAILKRSCYDCHSNNTIYPWYMNIQPVAWYLDHHIQEGKRELNFSEFGSYSAKKKVHKLQEVQQQIEEGAMPLSSYTLMHRDAQLSSADKQRVIGWVDSTLQHM